VSPRGLRRGQVNLRSHNSCLLLGAPSPGRRRACVLFGVSFRGGYSPTGLPGDTVWLALPPTGWGGLSVLSHSRSTSRRERLGARGALAFGYRAAALFVCSTDAGLGTAVRFPERTLHRRPSAASPKKYCPLLALRPPDGGCAVTAGGGSLPAVGSASPADTPTGVFSAPSTALCLMLVPAPALAVVSAAAVALGLTAVLTLGLAADLSPAFALLLAVVLSSAFAPVLAH